MTTAPIQAKIAETERDPNLCPFFDKTGTCMKGELCNKSHKDVPISRTIVLHHIFPDPDAFISMLPPDVLKMDPETKKRLVDAFFIDVACMLMQFGQLDDMILCQNKVDHLVGNVIALFHDSNAALAAKTFLDGQYYAGRKIQVSFVPIPRISLTICHNVDGGQCQLGNMCNFVHPLEPSPFIFNQIFPKAAKAVATPLRNPKKKRFIDNPNDALYGRTQAKIVIK